MSAPLYSAADYLSALQKLMPRGRVWPRDAEAIQTKTLAGLTAVYERNNQRANQLLVDAFPSTTTELIAEWESTLGLPDPCAGPAPTLQQRRAQVVATFANPGGQSIAYYIAYAKLLGYDITITQFPPDQFKWQINASLNTVKYFRTGISAAGESLASWGNDVLECEMNRIKPAHTTLIFSYS
jgi:uncharacterized protein YmfQ (DUF2313 family)